MKEFKIEDLDDLDILAEEIKSKFSVELGLYKDGVITKDKLYQAIKRGIEINDRVEQNAQKSLKRENMKTLVKVLTNNPDLLDNLKAIMDYRRLRIEQVLIPIWIEEAMQSPDIGELKIDNMRLRAEKLDKQRRSFHNKALGNFYGLNLRIAQSGLSPIYVGRIMNISDQPDGYGNHSIREEMTDGMLDLLYTIEDVGINELNIGTNKYDEGLGTFKEIHNMLNHQTHEYGIKKTLTKDDR